MISSFINQIFSKNNGAENIFEQSQLKNLLNDVLKKLDLVSRDEFDAQTAVLLRTRERLQSVEKQLATIELELKNQ